ncbi:M23 family metallopeptidase [bacterium]|nr:M23 family metallopeptidase [bacterium]MBU1983942.1 M23 family metallopeptidase [bacterium]
MAPRKFKLIYLSHDLTRKVELTFTHRKVRVAMLALAVVFLITNMVAGVVTSNLLKSRENQALRAENLRLRGHIGDLEKRIGDVNRDLAELTETDHMLRILADLPQVDEDVRQVGVGGAVRETLLDPQFAEFTKRIWSLDKIERELDLQKSSFEEIHQKFTSNAELLEHTPTLRPLEGGYISSAFGIRRDPFTKQTEHHPGVDIANERGTSVVATAAGEVIYSGHYFSYGRFVVLDHGFGYQTAYGHLNRINVRQGQYVAKGQKIGEVGASGRATGSHLHYEVRVNGRPVNPTDYFFEDVAGLPTAGRRN